MRMRDVLKYRERLPGRGWRNQRRWVVVLVAVGALLVGVLAAFKARAAKGEQIQMYWTHAALSETGRAQVVEVIDYDFGVQQRHGILRDIPGVDRDAPFEVRSPTAPDDLDVSGGSRATVLRVGDPNATVSGTHRYRIEYPTNALVRAPVMSWNAVGFSWSVRIDEVEIHVTAPFRFEDLNCDQGRRIAVGGCTVDQIEPGHLVVETSGLSAHEDVTVTATLGEPLAEPPAGPLEPTGPASNARFEWLLQGLAVAASVLLAALATYWVLRRFGRERVWSSRVSAAGTVRSSRGTVTSLDHRQLAKMASIEYAPPKDLSAAQGGIVLDEEVRAEHKTAWLLERVVDGDLLLESANASTLVERGAKGDLVFKSAKHAPVLVRSDEPAADVARIINEMFGMQQRLRLGEYDSSFALAWNDLETDLEQWRQQSGLWDVTGRNRRRVAVVAGIILALAGIGLAAVTSAQASRSGSPWQWVAIGGAIVAGIGLALLFGSWELRRRTPEGSSKWLQVESFRRGLASSEARHAQDAARTGLLPEYTAWAVSLGELDHWTHSVLEAAASPEADFGDCLTDTLFVRHAAHVSPSSATATATEPWRDFFSGWGSGSGGRRFGSGGSDSGSGGWGFGGGGSDSGGGGSDSGGGGGGGSSW